MSSSKILRLNAATALSTLAASTSAHAHHVNDGKVPTTFFQGMLSGLAHPVIGLDHLLFVLLAGMMAYTLLRKPHTIPLFLGFSLLGCLSHVARMDLPHSELGLTLTLLVGMGFLWTMHRSLSLLLPFFCLAGFFHGYAYGESIVGSGMPSLSAYLIGFTAIQALIAYSFGSYTQRLLAAKPRLFLTVKSIVSACAGLIALQRLGAF